MVDNVEKLVFRRIPDDVARAEARDFYSRMMAYRIFRSFSSDPIPLDVLETCIAAAGTSPSGANKQPWSFVVVTDPELKARIRQRSDEAERELYRRDSMKRWLEEMDWVKPVPEKPYLEVAPALIAVFMHHSDHPSAPHFYLKESIGKAVGILYVALERAGLGVCIDGPEPGAFLEEVLERPSHERAHCLMSVGYPTEDCEVPKFQRKALGEILTWHGPR